MICNIMQHWNIKMLGYEDDEIRRGMEGQGGCMGFASMECTLSLPTLLRSVFPSLTCIAKFLLAYLIEVKYTQILQTAN